MYADNVKKLLFPRPDPSGKTRLWKSYHKVKAQERGIAATEEETQNYSLPLLSSLSKAKEHWSAGKMATQVMLLGKLGGGNTKKATNPWGGGSSEIELEEGQDSWESHALKKEGHNACLKLKLICKVREYFSPAPTTRQAKIKPKQCCERCRRTLRHSTKKKKRLTSKGRTGIERKPLTNQSPP